MISIFRKMSKSEAQYWAQEFDGLTDGAFTDIEIAWSNGDIGPVEPEYIEMRNLLVAKYSEIVNGNKDESKNRLGYLIDLNLGLTLYECLNTEERFNTVIANDDDVWRYISCKVIPDLTYRRYPKAAQGDERINSKRFYSHTRRIWIKTLWWYIHLSWQGSAKRTYETLKEFGTDTISDFIERPGRGKGYRIPLFRAMVGGYASVENKSSDLFNRISKLNLVKCRTIEPALTENCEPGYVIALIREIEVARGRNA